MKAAKKSFFQTEYGGVMYHRSPNGNSTKYLSVERDTRSLLEKSEGKNVGFDTISVMLVIVGQLPFL